MERKSEKVDCRVVAKVADRYGFLSGPPVPKTNGPAVRY